MRINPDMQPVKCGVIVSFTDQSVDLAIHAYKKGDGYELVLLRNDGTAIKRQFPQEAFEQNFPTDHGPMLFCKDQFVVFESSDNFPVEA